MYADEDARRGQGDSWYWLSRSAETGGNGAFNGIFNANRNLSLGVARFGLAPKVAKVVPFAYQHLTKLEAGANVTGWTSETSHSGTAPTQLGEGYRVVGDFLLDKGIAPLWTVEPIEVPVWIHAAIAAAGFDEGIGELKRYDVGEDQRPPLSQLYTRALDNEG